MCADSWGSSSVLLETVLTLFQAAAVQEEVFSLRCDMRNGCGRSRLLGENYLFIKKPFFSPTAW